MSTCSTASSVMLNTLKGTRFTDSRSKVFPKIDEKFKKKLNNERQRKWQDFYDKWTNDYNPDDVSFTCNELEKWGRQKTKEDRRLRASGWQSGDETASESDFGDEENDVDDSDDVADSDDDHIEVDVCVEDDDCVENDVLVEDEDRVEDDHGIEDNHRIEDDERVEDDVTQRENVFAADSDDARILNDVTKSDVYVTESNEILSGDDPGNENEIPAVATREDSDDDDAREHDLMNDNAATMTFENPDDVTSQPNYDPTYEVSNVRIIQRSDDTTRTRLNASTKQHVLLDYLPDELETTQAEFSLVNAEQDERSCTTAADNEKLPFAEQTFSNDCKMTHLEQTCGSKINKSNAMDVQQSCPTTNMQTQRVNMVLLMPIIKKTRIDNNKSSNGKMPIVQQACISNTDKLPDVEQTYSSNSSNCCGNSFFNQSSGYNLLEKLRSFNSSTSLSEMEENLEVDIEDSLQCDTCEQATDLPKSWKTYTTAGRFLCDVCLVSESKHSDCEISNCHICWSLASELFLRRVVSENFLNGTLLLETSRDSGIGDSQRDLTDECWISDSDKLQAPKLDLSTLPASSLNEVATSTMSLTLPKTTTEKKKRFVLTGSRKSRLRHQGK